MVFEVPEPAEMWVSLEEREALWSEGYKFSSTPVDYGEFLRCSWFFVDLH